MGRIPVVLSLRLVAAVTEWAESVSRRVGVSPEFGRGAGQEQSVRVVAESMAPAAKPDGDPAPNIDT